jgi:hypothetical protein
MLMSTVNFGRKLVSPDDAMANNEGAAETQEQFSVATELYYVNLAKE